MAYERAHEKPENAGWSDWFEPHNHKLRHACCDCGLVHDIELRVTETGATQLRFKRNRRATHATRLNDRKRK